MRVILHKKWAMYVNENKLRRIAMALRMLHRGDDFEGMLLDLGLSAQDFMGFLESLALDFQVSILTLEEVDRTKSRVFSLWEQAFLSRDAREFLLSALHTQAITPIELEQALAVLFAQSQGFADVEDIRGILESIVQDPGRVAVLAPLGLDYIH